MQPTRQAPSSPAPAQLLLWRLSFPPGPAAGPRTPAAASTTSQQSRPCMAATTRQRTVSQRLQCHNGAVCITVPQWCCVQHSCLASSNPSQTTNAALPPPLLGFCSASVRRASRRGAAANTEAPHWKWCWCCSHMADAIWCGVLSPRKRCVPLSCDVVVCCPLPPPTPTAWLSNTRCATNQPLRCSLMIGVKAGQAHCCAAGACCSSQVL